MQTPRAKASSVSTEPGQSQSQVRVTATQTSEAGGRPGKEYWLNRGQALVLCPLSRTPQAAAVRKQIITVFMAYRAGKLVPAAPSGSDRIAVLAASVEALRIDLAALQETASRPERRLPPAQTVRAAVEPLKLAAGDLTDLLHGVKAIAAHLGVTPRQAKHLAVSRRVPTFKLGKAVCSTRSGLDASIARRLPSGEVRA